MIPAGTKVYFAVKPADLRRSFDGLSALAMGKLQKDPSEGGLLVFVNKRGNQARVETILGCLLELLRGISVLIWPAMPEKSGQMRLSLGLTPLAGDRSDAWPRFEPRPAGEALGPGAPLFPSLDAKAEEALLQRLSIPSAP